MQLVYNQRSVRIQDEPAHSHFGARWSFNYLEYISLVGTGTPNSQIDLVSSEGNYFNYDYSSISQSYGSRYRNLPQIQYLSAAQGGPGFRATASDGSVAEYFQYDDSNKRYYLTRRMDPQGNATVLRYDSQMRLAAVLDALGQTTTFNYVPEPGDQLGADTFRVRKVTDPFGRAARFYYNANGRLWKIVDCMGIVSEFHYAVNSLQPDFIDELKTPYTTTRFSSGEMHQGIGIPGRFIEAIDSEGDRERVEQTDAVNYPAGGVDPNPPIVVPAGDPNGTATVTVAGQAVTFRPKIDNLHWRNSYYWDKKAWSMGPGDYSKATVYNWLAVSDTITGVLGSMKRPLEGRVWFNYHGQSSNHSPGEISQPAKTLRAVEGVVAGQTQWIMEQTTFTLPDGVTPHPFGMPTGQIDAEGRQLRYLYSANGLDLTNLQVLEAGEWKNLLTFSNYTGHLPQTIVDASGLATNVVYNSRGQPTTVTLSKGSQSETTRYSYDRNLDGQSDENGYLIKIEHSGPAQGGQLVTMARFTYDGAARVRTATDESGYVTTYDYDNFDRVTVVTHPDGTTEQADYKNLHLDALKDRGGLWTRYFYNGLMQLSAEQDPQGRVTQYDWCKCGALSALIDPLGRTTRWKRDEQGRVMYKLLPDGTTKTSYAYQPLSGRLASMTSPNDQASGTATVGYSYAPAGQLVKMDYTDAGTPDVTYSYADGQGVPDPLARIRSMIDGIGTTAYDYQPLTGGVAGAGELWTSNGPWADDTLRYSYDWQGRRTLREVVTDGSGITRSESTGIDALGRPSQTVTGPTNGLGTFTYNFNAGNLSARIDTIAASNGLATSLGYYPLSASGAKALRLQTAGFTRTGSPISQFGYDYDSSGRISDWSRQSGIAGATTSSLAYNRSSELLGATLKDTAGAVIKDYSYRYDAAGNRYVSSDGPTTSHRQHNPLNQLTQIGGDGTTLVEGTVDEPSTVNVNGETAAVVPMPGSGLWKYEHPVAIAEGGNSVTITATDTSGNPRTSNYTFNVGPIERSLTYDLNGNLLSDATRSFTWDALNRLKSVTAAGVTYAWDYDGSDRRVVEKVNGTVTSRWLYDGPQVVQQRSGGDVVVKTYYAEGEVWATQTNAGSYFYTRDHLGSIRELVDNNGAVRASYDYDPYGVVIKLSGDLDADFLYTGHRYHRSSGLFLALYRAYDPALGCWLSLDPIGERGGVNLYNYGFNDPINLWDPDGAMPLWFADAIIAFDEHGGGTAANYLGGFSNDWLMGAPNALYNAFGIDSGVDQCSDAYRAGRWTSTAIGLASLGKGGAGLLAKTTALSGKTGNALQGIRRLVSDSRSWGAVSSQVRQGTGLVGNKTVQLGHLWVRRSSSLGGSFRNAGLNYAEMSTSVNQFLGRNLGLERAFRGAAGLGVGSSLTSPGRAMSGGPRCP